MKAATAIGIVIACVSILGAAVMEGTNPAALFNIPAMIIIFAGTAGATFGAVGMERFKLVPKLYAKAFGTAPVELGARVTNLVSFADRARKDGLLALEDEIEAIEDPFTRKGMQLVVDGTDPDLLREILEAEIDAMHARHKSGCHRARAWFALTDFAEGRGWTRTPCIGHASRLWPPPRGVAFVLWPDAA